MRERLYDYYPAAMAEETISGPEHWRERITAQIIDPTVYEITGENRELIDVIEGVGKLRPTHGSPVVRLYSQIKEGIREQITEEGCRFVELPPRWSGDPLPLRRPRRGRNRDSEYYGIDHYSVATAVDLGELTPAQLDALSMPITDQESLKNFMGAYSAATPETYPIAAATAREHGFNKMLPPHHVNFLFRKLPSEFSAADLEKLEPWKITAMQWVDMAHFGSFKVVEIFWRADDAGQPAVESIKYGTLEGGRPEIFNGNLRLSARDLARRINIAARTKEAGVNYVLDSAGRAVDAISWANRPSVRSLVNLSPLLKQYELVSDAIVFESLVNNHELADTESRLAGHGRQAESANCLWDPELGCDIVSKTGRLGADKTNMRPADYIGVRVLDNKKIALLPFKKINPGGAAEIAKPDDPSVEAQEFTRSFYEAAQTEPGFTFKVRKEGDAYIKDENGPYVMRRVTGVQHLHREVEWADLEHVIFIEPEDADAVGCGVDANDEKSIYAVKQAYRKGQEFAEQRGRWPALAVFYVPNHGWNALFFAQEDKNGRINSDLTRPFTDSLRYSRIVWGPNVTQV